ncbi:MAG: DUF1080 domain-containing protein, partial [Planctomycetaceae bacterium]
MRAFLPAGAVCFLLCTFTGCGRENLEPAATSTPAADTAGQTDSSLSAPTDKTPAKSAPSLEVADAFRLHSPPDLLLDETRQQNGWIQLFDGQTLFGWTAGNDIDWHVNETGDIEASQGEAGLLLTSVPFADYELQCDYWMSSGGNSGIFLRTTENPSNPGHDCYELNICDSHPEFKTGSLVARAQPSRVATGESVWKSFHIKVEGNRIQASLDGAEVLDFTDESDGLRTSGFIGLQKNAGLVRFRNVFLRPLGAQPVFDGTDLKNWKPVPGSNSTFSRTDSGRLSVTGGPGFLETRDTWDNFVLQFSARTNAPGLNGGVFFRLIPGTADAPSNGYELQIENVFLNEDRRQPKDRAGTGAIFRRSQARWVIPNDEEEFFTTLIAHGPRISTWVNGIQMTDWEDTRQPHENPRRGSRVTAGPMSLQGHDGTTDISFGDFRVASYPEGPTAAIQTTDSSD